MRSAAQQQLLTTRLPPPSPNKRRRGGPPRPAAWQPWQHNPQVSSTAGRMAKELHQEAVECCRVRQWGVGVLAVACGLRVSRARAVFAGQDWLAGKPLPSTALLPLLRCAEIPGAAPRCQRRGHAAGAAAAGGWGCQRRAGHCTQAAAGCCAGRRCRRPAGPAADCPAAAAVAGAAAVAVAARCRGRAAAAAAGWGSHDQCSGSSRGGRVLVPAPGRRPIAAHRPGGAAGGARAAAAASRHPGGGPLPVP